MIAETLGVSGPTICASGALIVDLPMVRLLRDVRIEADLATELIPDLATELIPDLTASIPGLAFGLERGLERGRDKAWPLVALGPVERKLQGGVIGAVDLRAGHGMSKLIC